MFALIDCDHFFASCERVFRPDLWRVPVAVLSNNDGCVIARSPEVKALGVSMGAPYFQCRSLLEAHRAHVFSANFSLYADLSARVVSTIRTLIESTRRPRVEVYSIDEAFVDLNGLSPESIESLIMTLRHTILQQVGIPVSIGVGESKTLAKAATYFAKRDPSGLCILSPDVRARALRDLPIEEVWGVGTRWSARLKHVGIERASALMKASERLIKSAARHQYLLRIARELNGEPCIPLEIAPPPRASVQYGRTFARPVRNPSVLRDALSAFAGELARRLRVHQRRAGLLRLSLVASLPHQGGIRRTRPARYWVRESEPIPVFTHDTPSLLKITQSLLTRLIARAEREAPHLLSRPIAWRKASLLALDLRDESQAIMPTLLPDSRRQALSGLEDLINQKFGRGSARIGGIPLKASQPRSMPSWAPKRGALSPRYTTSWADVPVVYSE